MIRRAYVVTAIGRPADKLRGESGRAVGSFEMAGYKSTASMIPPQARGPAIADCRAR